MIRDRVARIRAIADRPGVGAKAAGLRFVLARPAVVGVIPGAGHPDRIAEDRAALKEEVPGAFWPDLRQAGLIAATAPVPDGHAGIVSRRPVGRD